MQTLKAKEQHAWVNLAWTWIHDQVQAGERVFLPAGGTPTSLYRRFCEQPSRLLRSLRFVQIDEIVDGPKRGLFRRFFMDELKPFQEQMEWIENFNNADRLADVAILGVGVNGHVAFHEPGLPRDFYSGCVRLSSETRCHLELAQPTWGVTYGVATFMKAKRILVLAQGETKRQVLTKALREGNLPVSWILEHPSVTLITDFDL